MFMSIIKKISVEEYCVEKIAEHVVVRFDQHLYGLVYDFIFGFNIKFVTLNNFMYFVETTELLILNLMQRNRPTIS